MKKVIIIGIDGADWGLIKRFIKIGELPTFKKLMWKGTYGNLKSTVPAVTPPAWASLATGVDPGKHGIFHFCTLNGYDVEFVSAVHRRATPIWKLLSHLGTKVVVINVPMTYPPDRINGFMISGLDTPSLGCDFVFPKNFKAKLLSLGYRIDIGEETYLSQEGEGFDKFVSRVFDVVEKREKVTLELIKNTRWDFFFVAFTAPDRLQHFFWDKIGFDNPEENPILRVYKKIDEVLSHIIKVADDAKFFIVSDHGFGALNKFVYINSWLEKLGLLKIKKSFLQDLLVKVGVNERSLRVWINKLNRFFSLWSFLEHLPNKNRTRILNFVMNVNLDWSHTIVWSPLLSDGLRINLEGREPQGTVSREEYEEVRNYIINKLTELRDPENNRKVIAHVYKREELYKGDNIERAPDLIIQASEGYEVSSNLNKKIIGSPMPRNGSHRLDGIFLAYGNDIRENTQIDDVHIVDVAPTILHLMGIPILKDMGRVLKEIFKPESSAYCRKIEYTNDAIIEKKERTLFSGEQEEKIRERLRSLGYLG